jgi:hypothetical protein
MCFQKSFRMIKKIRCINIDQPQNLQIIKVGIGQ